MDDNSQTSIFRKESLERLSSPEQLDQLIQVVGPRSWLPLACLGSLMGVALIWSIVGRIPMAVVGRGVLVHPNQSSQALLSLTYFETTAGEHIQPGMEIILLPDIEGAERAGGVVARVKLVSDPPITTLDAARNAEMLNQQPTIQVLAELEPDPSTASGYRWSSGGGGALKLSPGTLTTARITLQEKAPIAFVFPFLEGSP